MMFKLPFLRISISAFVILSCFAACKKKKKDVEPEKPPVVVIPEDGPDLPANIKPDDLLMTGFIGGQAYYPFFFESVEFVYFPDNRLKEIRRIGPYITPENNPMFNFEYTGNLINAINAKAVGSTPFDRVDFTYNNGQISRAIYKHRNEPVRIDSLFYHANGNLATQKRYIQSTTNADELILQKSFSCVWANGNVTKETFKEYSHVDGRLIDTSTFQFTYTDRSNLFDQTVNDHVIWRVLNWAASEQLSHHLARNWKYNYINGQPRDSVHLTYSFDAEKLTLTVTSHKGANQTRAVTLLFKRK